MNKDEEKEKEKRLNSMTSCVNGWLKCVGRYDGYCKGVACDGFLKVDDIAKELSEKHPIKWHLNTKYMPSSISEVPSGFLERPNKPTPISAHIYIKSKAQYDRDKANIDARLYDNGYPFAQGFCNNTDERDNFIKMHADEVEENRDKNIYSYS